MQLYSFAFFFFLSQKGNRVALELLFDTVERCGVQVRSNCDAQKHIEEWSSK